MTGRAEGDKKRYFRNSGPTMMNDDGPLAAGRPGTELTSMAITFEDLGTEAGEVVLVPMPAGVAARAESGDQLPFPATGTTPQRTLCPAGRNLLDESRGRKHGESLRTAGMPLDCQQDRR